MFIKTMLFIFKKIHKLILITVIFSLLFFTFCKFFIMLYISILVFCICYIMFLLLNILNNKQNTKHMPLGTGGISDAVLD